MEQTETLEKRDCLVWTPNEVQTLLGLSRATVWLRIWDGSIPSFKIGGRVLIPKKGLAELLDGKITEDVLVQFEQAIPTEFTQAYKRLETADALLEACRLSHSFITTYWHSEADWKRAHSTLKSGLQAAIVGYEAAKEVTG